MVFAKGSVLMFRLIWTLWLNFEYQGSCISWFSTILSSNNWITERCHVICLFWKLSWQKARICCELVMVQWRGDCYNLGMDLVQGRWPHWLSWHLLPSWSVFNQSGKDALLWITFSLAQGSAGLGQLTKAVHAEFCTHEMSDFEVQGNNFFYKSSELALRLKWKIYLRHSDLWISVICWNTAFQKAYQRSCLQTFSR